MDSFSPHQYVVGSGDLYAGTFHAVIRDDGARTFSLVEAQKLRTAQVEMAAKDAAAAVIIVRASDYRYSPSFED